MSYLAGFGSHLPSRIVTNEDLSPLVGRGAEWIFNVSGIRERRWVDDGVTLVDLAEPAARQALTDAGLRPEDLGMILFSSGTSERQFPGPATQMAARLGLTSTPAIDLPVASAGSLVGLSLAADLAAARGPILVVASEIMSRVVARAFAEAGIAVLFGDGAGACVVHPAVGRFRVVGSVLGSDGAFAGDLTLMPGSALVMNGRSVILQASRKLPRVIQQLLERDGVAPQDVKQFVLHQANQNLLDKVADSLSVERGLFFSNILKYGNTSSASLLIALAEWVAGAECELGDRVCLAAFGAGFQWGALLAEA